MSRRRGRNALWVRTRRQRCVVYCLAGVALRRVRYEEVRREGGAERERRKERERKRERAA